VQREYPSILRAIQRVRTAPHATKRARQRALVKLRLKLLRMELAR
jgi:hypothetical protein